MIPNYRRVWFVSIIAGACFQGPSASALTSELNNLFDNSSGANTYFGPFVGTPYGLNSSNWVGGETGIVRNAGSQAFMSANGNQATDFEGNGLRKVLGGTIGSRPYEVSFAVATYLSLEGVELSDFTRLRIGGPNGDMEWLSTPKPTVNGQWLTWTGIYTPSITDIGAPFQFEAIWNLDARHAIALDGPVVAIAIPEPAMASMTCGATLTLFAVIRRRTRRQFASAHPWVS